MSVDRLNAQTIQEALRSECILYKWHIFEKNGILCILFCDKNTLWGRHGRDLPARDGPHVGSMITRGMGVNISLYCIIVHGFVLYRMQGITTIFYVCGVYCQERINELHPNLTIATSYIFICLHRRIRLHFCYLQYILFKISIENKDNEYKKDIYHFLYTTPINYLDCHITINKLIKIVL